MSDWHLEISNREWVVWGYKGSCGIGHVAPAVTTMKFGPRTIELKFRLPDGYNSGDDYVEAVELRRETKYGWRFKTNDNVHDTSWVLADTREEALAAARKYAEEQVNPHRPDETDEFLEAMDDTRGFNDGTVLRTAASILETI